MPSKKRVGRAASLISVARHFFPHLRLYHFQPYKGASGMGEGTCVCMVLRLHRPRRGVVGA